MKKLFFFFLAELVLVGQCLAAPSNTLSVSPSASSGQTITASDENSRNNTITSTYNAHTHTDITQLGTITTGVWNGTSITSAYIDAFNPQELTATASITEGAGTATDVDFGATDSITVTVDGTQTVVLMFYATWKNSDATGGIDLRITDDSNNLIDNQASLETAVAAEQSSATVIARDSRPASGTKVYKCRFFRSTAGTVTLTERTFIAFTLPDPS